LPPRKFLAETGPDPGYPVGMIKLPRFLQLALCLATAAPIAHGQGNPDAEAKFIAMLKNSTLKGTWAPVQQNQLGAEKKDEGYRIVRAEKKDGDKWAIVSLFEFQGKEVEYPIPAVVRFAGDTAVLILDNVQAGPGKQNWSARILFHENVYTGRWWETANKEHGGTIAGTITQTK
jgi:hypothetical protein